MNYKVVTLAVTGHANKIHYTGEIVTDHHFPVGTAERLVQSGHLKPIGDMPMKSKMMPQAPISFTAGPESKAKIGIGITTCARPEIFERTLAQIKNFSQRNSACTTIIYINDD